MALGPAHRCKPTLCTDSVHRRWVEQAGTGRATGKVRCHWGASTTLRYSALTPGGSVTYSIADWSNSDKTPPGFFTARAADFTLERGQAAPIDGA